MFVHINDNPNLESYLGGERVIFEYAEDRRGASKYKGINLRRANRPYNDVCSSKVEDDDEKTKRVTKKRTTKM